MATCRELLRQSVTPRTETRLRAVVALQEDVADVALTRELAEGARLDRRTERFEAAATFCRLVVRGFGPQAQSGAWRTFSLLFDMDQVFEAFIDGFMQAKVMPELREGHAGEFTLTTQGRGEGRHLLRGSGQNDRLRLEPDILLRYRPSSGGPEQTVAIDTKWKLAFNGKRLAVSNADLYQVYAYARAFDATTTSWSRGGKKSRRVSILLDGSKSKNRFAELHSARIAQAGAG